MNNGVDQTEQINVADDSLSENNNVATNDGSLLEKKHQDKEIVLTRSKLASMMNAQRLQAIEEAKREYESKIHSPDYQNLSFDDNKVSAFLSLPQVQEKINAQVNEKIKNEFAEREKQFQDSQINSQLQSEANSFLDKVEKTKAKYHDFDEVTEDFNSVDSNGNTFKLGALDVDFVRALNSVDNSADVFYEVAKNPSKLSSLISLRQYPGKFAKEIKNISESIKQNEASLNKKRPSPPLNQISSSPSGIDNGDYSIKSLRNLSYLRV